MKNIPENKQPPKKLSEYEEARITTGDRLRASHPTSTGKRLWGDTSSRKIVSPNHNLAPGSNEHYVPEHLKRANLRPSRLPQANAEGIRKDPND